MSGDGGHFKWQIAVPVHIFSFTIVSNKKTEKSLKTKTLN